MPRTFVYLSQCGTNETTTTKARQTSFSSPCVLILISLPVVVVSNGDDNDDNDEGNCDLWCIEASGVCEAASVAIRRMCCRVEW